MRLCGGAAICLAIVFAVLTPGAGAVSIEFVGPEETVFDWDTMRCFTEDVPDGSIRAFRDSSGRVQVGVRGADTRLIGPDFDNLTHDCTVVLADGLSPYPWDYHYGSWLAAPWTLDGQNIYALVHAEYHGFRLSGWCPGDQFQECRYNSVTFARSTDAGESFQQGPGRDYLVAALPYRYVPGDGRYGYFSPSNIVEKDGWYYSLLLVSARYREQAPGSCLMRTQNPADPKSWRAWDGEGFDVRFIDPYRESPEPVAHHVCRPVSPNEIKDMNRSLTFNTFLGKYVVTGVTNKYDPAQDRLVWGFYFSTSEDLIHWTDRQLLVEVETLQTHDCGDPNPRVYPGLIDHDSTSRIFSTVGEFGYLYFTELERSNCINNAERDMLRVPIRFSP